MRTFRFLSLSLCIAMVCMVVSCKKKDGNSSSNKEDVSLPTIEHAYVDLGLPSGTLWATVNVGANKPEENGDYFAWGETTPKNNYSWATYRYSDGSTYEGLWGNNPILNTRYTKYGATVDATPSDDAGTLELSDDVAYVKWGSSWRLPTRAECEELISNCTGTRTSRNGVYGYTFASSNGNSIFMPEGSYCRNDSLMSDYGEYGANYLSSTSCINDTHACGFAALLFGESEEGHINHCYSLARLQCSSRVR